MPVQSDRDRVYATIRARIDSGEWPPGHQLPSTRDLCDEFGVSKGTVEWAVGWLSREGRLVGHSGKGRYVAEPPTS